MNEHRRLLLAAALALGLHGLGLLLSPAATVPAPPAAELSLQAPPLPLPAARAPSPPPLPATNPALPAPSSARPEKAEPLPAVVPQPGGAVRPSASAVVAAVAAPPAVGSESPPRCQRHPKPAMPVLSRSLAETGTVKLRLRIGVRGEVLAVRVVQSSGFPRLDAAARQTLQQWRCQPAQRQGLALEAELEETVLFELE